MEYWNIGMMGQKKPHVFPIIPLFHYSNIPFFLLGKWGIPTSSYSTPPTSRYSRAMRTATPLVTWSRITE
jgi:hypothetical protein